MIGPAASTERTPTVSIILQSTVGGFSAQFMRKLPLVEQAMREHGLDPAEFVISKDYASTATIPLMGPFFYNYSVFFGDEQFTVTEPNDMVFLDYFFKRVLASDGPPESAHQPYPSRRHRLPPLAPVSKSSRRPASPARFGRSELCPRTPFETLTIRPARWS